MPQFPHPPAFDARANQSRLVGAAPVFNAFWYGWGLRGSALQRRNVLLALTCAIPSFVNKDNLMAGQFSTFVGYFLYCLAYSVYRLFTQRSLKN